MPAYDDDTLTEATHEQLAMLRELGITESELEDLSYAEAEAWLGKLQAEREDAGWIGRE